MEVESPDNLIVLLFKLFNAVVLLVTLVLTSWSCPPLTASVLPAPTVPSATLVILFPPALIPPVFVIDGPPVIVSPLLFNVESPILTLPFVPRLTFSASLMFNVSFPLASTAILLLVRFPVAPPLTFNFSPSFLSTSVPLSPPNFIGLFLTAFNCPTLTASSLSVPLATLDIVLPPALIPELFITMFPAPAGTVMLLKLTSLLVAIVKSFPA